MKETETWTSPGTLSKRQMGARPECGCLHSACPGFSGEPDSLWQPLPAQAGKGGSQG